MGANLLIKVQDSLAGAVTATQLLLKMGNEYTVFLYNAVCHRE